MSVFIQFKQKRIISSGVELSLSNFSEDIYIGDLLGATDNLLITNNSDTNGNLIPIPRLEIALRMESWKAAPYIEKIVLHVSGEKNAEYEVCMYSGITMYAVKHLKTTDAGETTIVAEVSESDHLYPGRKYDTTKIQINITDAGKASATATINGVELYTRALKFDRTNTRECKATAEIDPSCLSIPSNSATFTIDDGRVHTFDRNEPFELFSVSGEKIQIIGAFYVKSSRQLSGTAYRIEATDAVGILTGGNLDGDMHYGKIGTIDLIHIVAAGKVNTSIMPNLAVTELKGIVEKDTTRDKLVQICAATGTICDTTQLAESYIGFNVMKTSSACKEIPESRTYIGGSFSEENEKSGVSVTYRSFKSLLFSEDDSEYDEARRCNVYGSQIEGLTKVCMKEYTYRLTNNETSTNADEDNDLELPDCYLISELNYRTVAERLLAYVKRNMRYKVKILWDGEIPGDYVCVRTENGKSVWGNIIRMDFVMSTKTDADIEILVDDVTDSSLQTAIAGQAIATESVAGADDSAIVVEAQIADQYFSNAVPEEQDDEVTVDADDAEAIGAEPEAEPYAIGTALTKRNYKDNVTIITAKNLNEIQDAIIELQNEIRNEGTVKSVNDVLPDDSGNVQLAPDDVGAVDEDEELTILEIIEMWNNA